MKNSKRTTLSTFALAWLSGTLVTLLTPVSYAQPAPSCAAVFALERTQPSEVAVKNGEPALSPQAEIWSYTAGGRPGAVKDLVSRYGEILANHEMEVVEWINNDAAIVKFKGGLEGVWQRTSFRLNGDRPELAASAIALHIRAFVAPLTVNRTLKGAVGSVQLRLNPLELASLEADSLRFALFDYLIANPPRSKESYVSRSGLLIAARYDSSFGKNSSSANEFPSLVRSHVRKLSDAQSKVESLAGKLERAKNGDRSWLGTRLEEATIRTQLEEAQEAVKQQREQSIQAIRGMLFHPRVQEIITRTSDDQWRMLLSPHLRPDTVERFLLRIDEIQIALRSADLAFGWSINPREPYTPFFPREDDRAP